MQRLPILYIKPGCPWCREALTFFETHGIELDIRDVSEQSQEMDRMVSVSGQTMTPTFELGEFVVSDFDIDEFRSELEAFPEIQRQLGLADDED